MGKIIILCVEDEPAVRDALVRDLEPFAAVFGIEEAEDVKEAEEVIAACVARGDRVGLVLCDHVLPGESGVDFLVRLHGERQMRLVRKVLVTGQAGHEDTIRALNEARLDHYIAKPWQPEALQAVVRDQLTAFVIAEGSDPLPFMQILDGARLLDASGGRRPD